MAQYTPKTWTTGETIDAAKLNAIEQAAAAAAVKTDADAAYDAKGAATTAQAAAVAAAATDATTKASGAQSAATAAAATDATAKANAAQAAAVQRANHTGTQSADTLTDGTTNKAYTATEKTKLAGIATGATANVVGAAGSGAGNALSANDPTTTNARTPTAHTHPIADLTATGTRDITTFLRGDGTWATTPAAAGAADATTTTKGLVQLTGDLAGTAAAPTVPGLAGKLAAASNLSDLASAATARTNLGLGTAATQPASAFDAAGAATAAAAGKAPLLTPTATKTAAYTAAVGDLAVMNVAGGATALTLPTAPADKSTVGFLAVGATAATPLTVNRGGTDTVGPAGATSITAPLSNEATVYQYDAANTRWLAVSNVKPLAALDARYALSSTLGATVTADATVKAAYGPDSGRLLPAPPVTTKVNMMYNGLSNGTDTSTTYRNWVDLGVNCRDIRLVFVNSYTNFSGTQNDTPGPNPINVKASIELESNGQAQYTKGTLVPVYFGRDGRTSAIQPGGVLISDPIPGDFLAGQGFYVNSYVSVASAGQTWPVGRWNSQGGTYTMDGTAPNADGTDVAVASANVGYVLNNRAYSYMPVAIIGTPVNRSARSVVVFGNSIPTGTANAGNVTDGAFAGYVSQAFKGKAGLINLAQPSEKASDFLLVNSHNTRGRLVQCGATDAFVDYVNTQLFGDNNSTFATVTLAMQQMFAWAAVRGFRVHAATCTPRTTSTDSWATTANQTTNAKDSLRVQVNAWLRAGAPQNGSGLAVVAGTGGAVVNPNLYSVHEVADQVETARDSGIWKAGYTGDGVHPNETGSAAMATGVNTTTILN